MNEVLKIENFDFFYNKEEVFNNLNFIVEKSTFVAMSGPNKCGKTTLIKIIGDIIPMKKESIYNSFNKEEIGIVLSYDNYSFLKKEVFKELAFPLENLSYPDDLIEKIIINTANYLKIEDLLDKKTKDLTSKEKQKLIFALGIIHSPSLLILDSPFSMLTRKEKEFYRNILKELNEKEKTTIIMATNDLEDTLNCDILHLIDKKQIIKSGNPIDIMKEEKTLKKLGLEMPVMVDFSLKLMFYEILDDITINVDRMVDKLWK